MIEASHSKDSVVIQIMHDELDLYLIPDLRKAISSQLEVKPATVVFDMQHVKWIDSTAIGSLFYFNKEIKSYGGKLTLVNLGEHVKTVLTVTQALGTLAVSNSTSEALDKSV